MPAGCPGWFAMVFDDQADRIRALETAGFACVSDVGDDSWSQVLLNRPGDLLVPTVHLPEGYRLRALAGETEVSAYVTLPQTVFESRNMTIEWRAWTLASANYSPDLDLVAVAPDGRLAAFCICWLDRARACGQVEPLGVHPGHRRLGLGSAILAEGLSRLHHHGARAVLVQTDVDRSDAVSLYEAAGITRLRDVLICRKDDGSE